MIEGKLNGCVLGWKPITFYSGIWLMKNESINGGSSTITPFNPFNHQQIQLKRILIFICLIHSLFEWRKEIKIIL